MRFGSLRVAQAFAIVPIAEAVEFMQRRIAGLRRDSFGIQSSDEIFCRDACKFFGVYVEDVGVVAVSSATRIANLRGDAGNVAEQLVEQPAIAMPVQGLRFEAAKLDV